MGATEQDKKFAERYRQRFMYLNKWHDEKNKTIMETEQKGIKANKRKGNLKKGAKISLTVLLLYVVGQLATVYQTRSQIVSPIIPESIIWEINKEFIFTAFVFAIAPQDIL